MCFIKQLAINVIIIQMSKILISIKQYNLIIKKKKILIFVNYKFKFKI